MKTTKEQIWGSEAGGTVQAWKTTTAPFAETDVVILDTHGGMRHKLQDKEPLSNIQKLLARFMTLQRDIGSTIISNQLHGMAFQAKMNMVGIQVVPPRGLVDAIRTEECATKFDMPDQIKDQLTEIHRDVTRVILNILEETRPQLVLDIHTMAPATPTDTHVSLDDSQLSLEKPKSFERQIEFWNHAARHGIQRPTGIIDSMNTGELIGNRPFAENLFAACDEIGMNPAMNRPLTPTRERHQGQKFIAGNGVAIDVPKNLLVRSPKEKMDLTNTEDLDGNKIRTVSNAIFTAIEKSL